MFVLFYTISSSPRLSVKWLSVSVERAVGRRAGPRSEPRQRLGSGPGPGLRARQGCGGARPASHTLRCALFSPQRCSRPSAEHHRGEGARSRRQPQRRRGEWVGGQRLRVQLRPAREPEHWQQRHAHHPELRRCVSGAAHPAPRFSLGRGCTAARRGKDGGAGVTDAPPSRGHSSVFSAIAAPLIL